MESQFADADANADACGRFLMATTPPPYSLLLVLVEGARVRDLRGKGGEDDQVAGSVCWAFSFSVFFVFLFVFDRAVLFLFLLVFCRVWVCCWWRWLLPGRGSRGEERTLQGGRGGGGGGEVPRR